MEKMIKEYEADKMEELKKRIEEKRDELLAEINHVLGNNDNNTYQHLKSLQLQCDAELRLIKHIETNFEDKNFIIC